MRLRLKEPMDGSSVIFCGIEFQIVVAANLKALRPTALAVKGTCNMWLGHFYISSHTKEYCCSV